MPFVKLDCGILRSTIWFDTAARDVFLTALLLAEPREFTEAQAQLEVRRPDGTGWAVPPGWYGFVPASGVGIAHAALVDVEKGLDALERMGNPEADSRTPDFDGRRLVRVAGGFVVLNYMRYRDRDSTAAERQRRLRERRSRDGVTVTRNITHSRVQSTEAEERSTTIASSAESEPEEAVVAVFPVQGGGEWGLGGSYHATLATAFPSADLHAEYRKMIVWLQGDEANQKTPRGMKRFIYGWIERGVNRRTVALKADRKQSRSGGWEIPR